MLLFDRLDAETLLYTALLDMAAVLPADIDAQRYVSTACV